MNYDVSMYKLKRKIFAWNQDHEGDLVLSIFGLVHLVKYKESVLFQFGKKDYIAAEKYQGHNDNR